jgi:hypothetical protein
LHIVLSKWKTDNELSEFVIYFERQWINSKYGNWQLFKTPVGFAMTNSPIESYNNTIKESFTKRIKYHMKSAVEVFQDIVSYESRQAKEFKNDFRVQNYMRVQAKAIVLKKQLIATLNDFEFLYKHFNTKLGFAKINLNSKSCTFHKYFDKGVCKHLVAACLQNKISLPGLEQLPKKFKLLRRKKRNNYINESVEEEDLVQAHEQPLVSEIQEQPTIEVAVQEPIKPKRGREPKTVTNTNTDNPLGRPILARNALENDTAIDVGLRRSKRNK